jgi:hypothetical protein
MCMHEKSLRSTCMSVVHCRGMLCGVWVTVFRGRKGFTDQCLEECSTNCQQPPLLAVGDRARGAGGFLGART